MNNGKAAYNLDYGTKVSTVNQETISVSIDPTLVVNRYASATIVEMQRLNPIKFDTMKITEDELMKYFTLLLNLRIRQVNNLSVPWREMKQLWMPAWIQFALEGIGEVILNDQGLRFVPVEIESCDSTISEAMYKVSDILRAFQRDGLAVVDNGFSTSRSGDPDTMTLCILDGYVKGIKAVHPVKTYVATFLGQKLLEEDAFRVLYRIRYDDVNFVASSLIRDRKLYQNA